MLDLSLLLSAAIAAHAVVASPVRVRTDYALKEFHPAPPKWAMAGRAPGNHMLHMQIGLKQGNFAELERHLYEVSDPDHARYGQHLQAAEVEDLIKPTEESLDLVHEWLLLNGVSQLNYSPAKDWVNIYIDVESAERLLDTEYSVFEHEDGSQLIRTQKWSLPTHLHEHIDTIQPTNSFMRSKPQSTDFLELDNNWVPPSYSPPSNADIAKVCNISSVTLQCFNTLYGTKGYIQKVPGINHIGFNNYLNQTPIRPDIYDFLKKYNPPAAASAYTFQSVEFAGGPAAQYSPLTVAQAAGPDFVREANLDAQTILGMTFPQPVTSFSTGGSPPFVADINTPTDTNEPYMVWANSVSTRQRLPQVISSSYGDDEQTVPKSYAERVCAQFAQLGARGTTLLVSSGDGALGGLDNSACFSNDGKNTSTFLPAFPASCPYVTTVGATMMFEPEKPAFRAPGLSFDGRVHGYYASGSGFSYYFDRPKYQDGTVDTYINNLPAGLYKGLYNPNGRGYPDLAAQGLYFAFFFNQTESTISGTSASCPLMSSIISLVNDALIAKGRSPLGFLNYALYKNLHKGFTDIVGGNASSCGTVGFPVTEGWDPSTGFGTPKFREILGLLGLSDGW